MKHLPTSWQPSRIFQARPKAIVFPDDLRDTKDKLRKFTWEPQLVGGFNLSEKWWSSVSWDFLKFPIWWEIHKIPWFQSPPISTMFFTWWPYPDFPAVEFRKMFLRQELQAGWETQLPQGLTPSSFMYKFPLPSGNLLHSYWKWPSRNSG